MPRPNKGPRLEMGPHGNHEIRWTIDGRTKRLSTGTPDMAEAQRFFAGWLLEESRAKENLWTVGQVLDFYKKEYLDEGHTAAPENELHRMKPLRAFFSDYLPRDIDVTDVNEYKRRRRNGKLGRKVADSTIRRELGVLIAALNFCADNKKIARGDVPAIELPAAGDPRDFWLVDEELDLLMEAAQPPRETRLTRAYRFIAAARYTAARKEAIVGLDWFRISRERKLIDYRKPGTKRTKKRRVPVPIADELAPIIERAFKEKTSEFFLDHAGSIRKTLDTTIERAAKMAEAKGRPDMAARIRRTTPHVFRHTWTTLKCQRGWPLWKVAGILGDTLATVEKNYAHHCPDHLRDVVNSGAEAKPETAIPEEAIKEVGS